jgi:hypothetical protein
MFVVRLRLGRGVTLAESSWIELYAKPDSKGGSQGTNESPVVVGPSSVAPEPMVPAGSCPEFSRPIGLDVCRGKMALGAATSQYAAGH